MDFNLMLIDPNKLLNVFGFQVQINDINWHRLLLKILPKIKQYFIFNKSIVDKLSPNTDNPIKDRIITKFFTLTNSDALIEISNVKPDSDPNHYILETNRPFLKEDIYSINYVIELIKSTKMLEEFNCYYSHYESGTWKQIDTLFISFPYYKDWESDQALFYWFDKNTYNVLKELFNYKGDFPESSVIIDDNFDITFTIEKNITTNHCDFQYIIH